MRWVVSRRTDSASCMLAAPTMTWPNNCIPGPGNIAATKRSFSVMRPIRGQPSTRYARISTILGARRDWITRSTQSVPPTPSGSVLGAICTVDPDSLNPLAGCRPDFKESVEPKPVSPTKKEPCQSEAPLGIVGDEWRYLQALFKTPTRAESHGLGSLDLDRRARLRVVAHPRGTLAYAKFPKAGDLHRPAGFYASLDRTQHRIQRPLGGGLADFLPHLLLYNLHQLRLVHSSSWNERLWLLAARPVRFLLPQEVVVVNHIHPYGPGPPRAGSGRSTDDQKRAQPGMVHRVVNEALLLFRCRFVPTAALIDFIMATRGRQPAPGRSVWSRRSPLAREWSSSRHRVILHPASG